MLKNKTSATCFHVPESTRKLGLRERFKSPQYKKELATRALFILLVAGLLIETGIGISFLMLLISTPTALGPIIIYMGYIMIATIVLLNSLWEFSKMEFKTMGPE